tara:strand:+ start:12810 stop:13178 length:369 start_codon:yes stop_codon:yes gene_type:complete
MKELQNQVAGIVETLAGNFDNYCRECEIEHDDNLEECPDCSEALEPMSGFDYLTDALDIEYIVNGKAEYLGARVLVCFGGPNVWINTRSGMVEGYWWQDSCTLPFTDGIGLDDALSELWECR